jgi:putative transcriptional regulator
MDDDEKARLRELLTRNQKDRYYKRRPENVDVIALRVRMGMTQEQFAARFGFPVATLRHWERGDRFPRGAARVLLNVIERDPKAVLRALTPRWS